MKQPFFVFEAVKQLAPEAEFSLWNDDIETLQWIEVPYWVEQPSKEQILARVDELKSAYALSLEEQKTAKESAVSKLLALGLTEKEIASLSSTVSGS